jgi:hypothetical protein
MATATFAHNLNSKRLQKSNSTHLFDWRDAANQGYHPEPNLLAKCLQVLTHLQQTQQMQQASNNQSCEDRE